MATIAVSSEAPEPLQSAPGRLDSVDLLRGLVMAIMALDHTRDYFTHLRFAPEDLSQTWGTLFFTRWITHLCAPTFFFLAGTGIYLSRKRGGELSKFLVTRGLWLVLLEVTIVHVGWIFGWSIFALFGFLVIWALGWSMVAMAGIARLPVRWVGVFGLAMILLHNLTDKITPAVVTEAVGRPLGLLWAVLHQPGFHTFSGAPPGPNTPGFFVLYPLVPWIGVMAAGFWLGSFLRRQQTAEQRRRRLFLMGLGVFALFAVLRATNLYGNPPAGFGFASPGPFVPQATTVLTIIAFFNVEKYPPSLQYLGMTLGISLMLLAWFERIDIKAPINWLWEKILVFGRVPMFYYILHLYVIHALAIAVAPLFGQPWKWMINGGFFAGSIPPGYGHNLPFIYLMWLTALVILYFPCKWYADLKQRRKDLWFLSYI